MSITRLHLVSHSHVRYSSLMKTVRLWATTDPETYQELLILLALSVDKNGKKMRIGEFVEQAVKEKIEREKKSKRNVPVF